MKIESHNLTFQTEHEFSYEKTDTYQEEFSTLLETIPIPEEEEVSSPQDEVDLISKIKFALIQELLQLLFPQDKSTCKASPISLEENPEVAYGIGTKKFERSAFIEVEYESTYYEEESLSVQTQGLVKTEDGRSFDINLELNMYRSFYSKTTLSESVFIDPLVISLDGDIPNLSNETFSFDIDCDGESDQISCLAKNSGFLALDINENGFIDDGNELFGTKSGNGFADLGKYDEDKNFWIDENDPIFDGLRIWSDDKLIALGEVGVGAIYLGSTESPYTYKNDDNQALAKLSSTGCFLYESGEVGTIAQMDFAKDPLNEALSKV